MSGAFVLRKYENKHRHDAIGLYIIIILRNSFILNEIVHDYMKGLKEGKTYDEKIFKISVSRDDMFVVNINKCICRG